MLEMLWRPSAACTLLLLALIAPANARWPIYTPERLVADFEADRFYQSPFKSRNTTGHEPGAMKASGGREYDLDDLDWQAQLLADHGRAAFPAALALIDHKEGYMRYIGRKALNGITGLNLPLPGEPADAARKDGTYALEVKRLWQAWYDQPSSSQPKTETPRK